MKTLIAVAVALTIPAASSAQSQLGNSMGAQSSAAPSSTSPNDPSNAGKTPTARSDHRAHMASHKRTHRKMTGGAVG